MVPNRRGKIVAHKKAFRFKNKTVAIRVYVDKAQTVLTDRVVDAKVSPSGFLAYHPSVNEIGYSITHIPTGMEIGVAFSEIGTRHLIESIDGDDWDFHTLTQKLKKQLRKKYSALIPSNA